MTQFRPEKTPNLEIFDAVDKSVEDVKRKTNNY